jgi:cyclic pyranopterin phosphate synthase
MNKLGHIDENGKINMIDNTGKPGGMKEAEASGFLHLKPETVHLIRENELEKGEVITMAEIAGMQAAKRTAELIPLVHQTILTRIDVKAYVFPNGIEVKSLVKADSPSSLEAEALVAVGTALMTLYEMCKTADPSMTISDIRIQRKTPIV